MKKTTIKKRAAIFVDVLLRDAIKKLAKSNNRTIGGQIKHWLESSPPAKVKRP